jgi:hypothetical protein
MATGYFDNFPSLLYANMVNPNAIAEGDFVQVVNIFARVGMLKSILSNIDVFFSYPIKDSDTPEIIAAKLYHDPTLYWLVLFANQYMDPYFQWPLSDIELQNNLVTSYGSVANALSTIDHYEKHTNVTTTFNYESTTNVYVSMIETNIAFIDGSTSFPTIANPILQVGANTIISFPNGTLVDTSVQLLAISAYDNAVSKNEALRTIQLVRPEHAPQIAKELQALLSQ